MTATPAWLAVAESRLNRGIEASLEASSIAARLDGTLLRLEITGLAIVHCGMRHGRLSLSAASGQEFDALCPNATIAGSVLSLLALNRSNAIGTARSAAHASVRIGGDAEVANTYRLLFLAARPDIEEEISRVIGDLPARRLSALALGALAWFGNVRRTARGNIAEYLQEESRDLVGKTEVEEFAQGVDALRERVDRTEARLLRLEQRMREFP